jgi:hypothetical protein
MPTIKLPTGDVVIAVGTPEEAQRMQTVLEARYAFTLAYCKSKGWPEDPEKLSFDQIFEIRSQPGWQDPLKGSG